MASYEMRVHLIAVLLATASFVLIVELVRRRRLGEWQSLSWLAAAMTIGIFAADRRIQFVLAGLVGIYYPPILILGGFVFGGLAILLLQSLTLARLQLQNRRLAQTLAILELRLEGAESPRPKPNDSEKRGL